MVTEFVEDVKQQEVVTQISEPLTKKATDDSVDSEMNDYISKFLDMSNNARDTDSKEKHMSLAEGIKTFPKAAFWSVVLSTALIMEGYDTNLINSFYGFPAFTKKYGEYYPESDSYEVPTKWQTSISMAIYCGEVLGLYLAGIMADRIGYRKTLINALIALTAFIFVIFFSSYIETPYTARAVLLTGYILVSIPYGFFQTLTLSYAAEICPLVLRIYLTTYVNMCWVFGQLISSGILRGFVGSSSESAYKIPFAIQWAWPVPIMIGIYLAPESPWWLVKKGKLKEAKHSLTRLLTENEHLPSKDLLATAMVEKMQMTYKEEELFKQRNSASYADCFKGSDFRRTRIACMVWLTQSITGASLMGYSTYFYIQAGLSTNMSFTFSIIQYVLGLIGTVGSWFLSQKVGRFSIYFYGLCAMFTILVIVGGLGCSSDPNASWGIGSLLLIFTFVYDLTIGPICYCLVAEMPTARLRTKTIILARNTYNIAGIVTSIISPYMLNPTAWNWKAKTGFFWSGFAFFCAIYCWFDLPETKNRTFAELDILFNTGVPARKFKKTQVNVFDTGDMMEKLGDEGIKNMMVQHNEVVETEKA
ncbi:sugar transporter [Hyphopichia burtonii NRRL Y-1933]|uniref:Sugar transporter n=1 Tax=Hyphopichia burtonii NRRL Y-1933 TaxID=984485 RepID=A0A1E4RKP9_9ASCO|nr:sugar transporter [Hyphopichia burtonii NRRL Y-1933]ODV67862.1 sugar transporter [Hyphopichia burtonii NRRL Y-1933]